MQWTRLAKLAEREWHSPATVEFRDQLNARIEECLENRKSVEQQLARALETPLEEIDPEAVFASDIPELILFGLLKQELQIRRDLPSYFRAEDADRDAAYTEAFADRERLEKELRAGLVNLGFRDVPPTSGTPGYIQPIMIFRNPIIMAADARLHSLRHELRNDAQARQNSEAQAELMAFMERLRSRARSVA